MGGGNRPGRRGEDRPTTHVSTRRLERDVSTRDGKSPLASRALLAAGLPVLLTCVLCVAWSATNRIRLFGDEPHYVIIGASIARDGDLELRNNYSLEARYPRDVGIVDPPHVWKLGHHWYSTHGPALGALIAPGLAVGGALGARLTTCLLAALLPVSIFVWLKGLLGPRDAVWLTLAATLSVPYVFGAVHLYPDPVAAAVSAPLLVLLGRGDGRPERPMVWAVFWLACGALPLLMVKFLAPALLLAGFALARAAALPPGDRAAVLRTAPLLLVGPSMLAAYHRAAFGTVLGPRGPGELSPPASQFWMVLLGLHLDQAQGVFVQQPLLLAGVAALGVVSVRRPLVAAAWTVLYASLIVPSALQVIPYGGASPSGRFAWPAGWLWLVPLGLVLSWYRDRLARTLPAVLLAVFAYGTALALRWLPHPMSITNEFTPDLALRNSLFPVAMRPYLPSFYATEFLAHTPNLVAIVAVSGLVVGGVILGFRLERRRP